MIHSYTIQYQRSVHLYENRTRSRLRCRQAGGHDDVCWQRRSMPFFSKALGFALWILLWCKMLQADVLRYFQEHTILRDMSIDKTYIPQTELYEISTMFVWYMSITWVCIYRQAIPRKMTGYISLSTLFHLAWFMGFERYHMLRWSLALDSIDVASCLMEKGCVPIHIMWTLMYHIAWIRWSSITAIWVICDSMGFSYGISYTCTFLTGDGLG